MRSKYIVKVEELPDAVDYVVNIVCDFVNKWLRWWNFVPVVLSLYFVVWFVLWILSLLGSLWRWWVIG
jgi:hypothetical protein